MNDKFSLDRQEVKTARTLARLLGVSVPELATFTLRLFLPDDDEPRRQNEELIEFLTLYLDLLEFDTRRQAASLKRRLDNFIGHTQVLGSPRDLYPEITETEGYFIVVLHHLGVNGWEPQNGPRWDAKRKKWPEPNDAQ